MAFTTMLRLLDLVIKPREVGDLNGGEQLRLCL